MTGRSLFVLVPPSDYTLAMPNFGDRALHEGMRRLLAASSAGELLYDGWNSFPRMTLARLLGGGMGASERLDAWRERLQRQAATPAPLGQALSDLLFGPAFAWLPLWPLLDRAARKRTGQTGRDALWPRLLPGLAARRFALQLAASDAVLMNAGGLLADHLGHYLPGRIFALHAAQAAGRPTALVNYTFAISRPELLAWVAPVVRRVDLHAVRESQSRERLLALGVAPDRIRIVPDAAIAAGIPEAVSRESAQLTVAIQVRGDRPPDIDAWAALIEALRSRLGARVVYLHGCLKHDPPVLERLQRATGLDLRGDDGSEIALKRAIGRADLLITDRYHGMIFATQTGTPFLPLATTSHKSTGFVADLDYPVEVQPELDSDNLPRTLATAEALVGRREQIAGELAAKAALLTERVFGEYSAVIDHLFSLAERPRPKE